MRAKRAVISIITSGLFASGFVMQVYAQTVTVVLRDGAITPASMSGKVGTKFTVNVRNEGKKVHNLVIPDFFIFTQNLQPGETAQASFSPDKAGSFPFYSDTGGKPESGMRGTLTVTR